MLITWKIVLLHLIGWITDVRETIMRSFEEKKMDLSH